MKLKKVSPLDVKVPEVRVTSVFDEEMKQMLQGSIKQVGLVAPIICCEVEAEFILVDGLHRLQEAIAQGWKTIDVAVIDGDMIDVLTKNIMIDHVRGKHPVSQMVKVIEALWKEYKLDSEQIAAKTGFSRDYVEKLQLISELTPMCRQALDEGRIGVGHAAALTRLKDPIKQDTVLQQLLMYRWGVKELEQYIKDVLAIVEQPQPAQVASQPAAPAKVRCRYCGEEHDPFNIAAPPTCVGCSGILLNAIAMARAEALQHQEETGSPGQALT